MQNSKKYKGTIVEEGLEDRSVLGDFDITETTVTDDENPNDRWHMHKVLADMEQIEKLSKVILPTKFYSHFWDEEGNMIVVFRDKIFSFHKDDLEGMREPVEYGLTVGIPEEQLDFLTE
jgi:hypothetical protein